MNKPLLAFTAFGPVMLAIGVGAQLLVDLPFNPVAVVGLLVTCTATPIGLFWLALNG